MKVVSRYLALSSIGGIALALLALTAIDGVFSFIGEAEDIGRGDYGLGDVVLYVALILPSRAYELFPSASLLGVLLGVGALAARSELVSMRAAGLSRLQLAHGAMIGAIVMLVPMWVVGEFVAPGAEQSAQQLRVRKQEQGLAITPKISSVGGAGFWLRAGNAFVHADQVLGLSGSADELRLSDLLVYEFEKQALENVTVAKEARFESGAGWRLNDVHRLGFGQDGLPALAAPKSELRDQLINPELLQVVVVKPRYLSMTALWRYAKYLRQNGLDARAYEIAFWGRAVFPLTAMVMVFAALPFVFGVGQRSGVGQRLFVGMALGLGFAILNRMAVGFGNVYQFNAMISAAAPTLLLAVATWWILRRGR